MNSIGDFAENLILGQVEDIQKGKSLPPKLEEAKATAAAPAKDISNIKVPDEMMQDILGEGFHPQDTPPTESLPELVWDEPEPAPKPTVITEETAQELVSLLEEVRGMISDLREMTTAGMMGVNLGGPAADPMSPHKKKAKKAVLLQKIRKRIK